MTRLRQRTSAGIDLAGRIDDRSARGIAAAVGRLISSGDLADRQPAADGAGAVASRSASRRRR